MQVRVLSAEDGDSVKSDSFYTDEELAEIGLMKYGTDIKISKKASIYSPEKMCLGDHVRIDDFCILSGRIRLGSYIHIAAYSALYGGNSGISMDDFSCLSSRCCVYAVSDDYSGDYLTNAVVPDKYKNVSDLPVHLEKYVLIGSGSVILPGTNIGEGTAVGSLSFVKHDLESWKIYAGVPAKMIKKRSNRMLDLLKEFKENNG